MTSKSTREERVQSLYDLKIGQVLNQSDIESIKMLARMALAAMDSEPVGYFGRFDPDDEDLIDQCSKNVKGAFPLYRHAQQPVVPDERAAFNAWNNEDNLPIAGVGAKNAAWLAWQARAELAGNSPVIPEGYVMVPMRLTAENGAKGALSGEFSETKFVNCPECFGDDECETCDGSGRIEITVPVTWTTIKEIWAKGVEHFAAALQEVPDGK
ncbi:hypothetical protein [Klebsiella michiganensis]|uniref:hypothetical protein n=1 Tax=Klebsiella michiganensis TaxID=1134687 RepID=UPI000FF8D825|nr:hypothetical protein [Klebsiella michiganensis]QAS67014.1 hypothetical protein KOCBH_04569 [Klebsiella michiganensis]